MTQLRWSLQSLLFSAVFTLCLLALVSPAGAQGEETSTTFAETTTTTTEAPTTSTTSTTVPPVDPTPDPPAGSGDELGSREALQWLAFLASFYIGHGLTR